MSQCNETDARGDRCTVVGAHTEIVNSKGQRALAHSSPVSMWSTPVVGIVVPPAPREPFRLP